MKHSKSYKYHKQKVKKQQDLCNVKEVYVLLAETLTEVSMLPLARLVSQYNFVKKRC